MRSDRPRGTRAQLHRGELITALLRAARLCESICAVCWYFGGGCGLWFVAVFIPSPSVLAGAEERPPLGDLGRSALLCFLSRHGRVSTA